MWQTIASAFMHVCAITWVSAAFLVFMLIYMIAGEFVLNKLGVQVRLLKAARLKPLDRYLVLTLLLFWPFIVGLVVIASVLNLWKYPIVRGL